MSNFSILNRPCTQLAALFTLTTAVLGLSPRYAVAQRAPLASSLSGSKLELGNLPLSFEPNRGQTNAAVQWISRGPEFTLFLAGHDAVLQQNAITPAKDGVQQKIGGSALRMNLLGAQAVAATDGELPLAGKVNYLNGRDQARWQRNVPTFGRVRLEQVYPGIDLAYYGQNGRLEYDFVVAPGADASAIHLGFDGAKARLATNGDLVLPNAGREVRFDKPAVYQMGHGRREPVESSFTLAKNGEVSFHLGQYDHSRELVIDPTLVFLGTIGTGNQQTVPNSIAVDAAGELFLTGITNDLTFPVTMGAFQTDCGGSTISSFKRCGPSSGGAGFVTKISADGKSLVYSTYLHGGVGAEYGQSIALDAAGDAYVLGYTQSNDFPITADAYQPYCAPYYPAMPYPSRDHYPETSGCNRTTSDGFGVKSSSLFVIKLNPTGDKLLYGTFFGGTPVVAPESLALDAANNIYFTASTQENIAPQNAYPVGDGVNYPVTPTAFQPFGQGEFQTGFSKLSADGHTLLYSTAFGGTNTGGAVTETTPLALAVGQNGLAYVGGRTRSNSYPTTPSTIEPRCPPSTGSPNACQNPFGFVAAFDTTKAGAASLFYSTYIGGNQNFDVNPTQQVDGLAVDGAGNLFATGFTYLVDFPVTPGAFQTTCAHDSNGHCNEHAFLSKINPNGSAFIWSTYYAGPSVSQTEGDAIALDTKGRVYLFGQVGNSYDLPSKNPLQTPTVGPKTFIATFTPDGTRLLFGTILGNSNPNGSREHPALSNGLVLDPDGNIYVAGSSDAGNTFTKTPGTYSTPTAFGNGGLPLGFFAKVSAVRTPSTTALSITPTMAATGQSVTFAVSVVGTTPTTPAPSKTVVLTNTAVSPNTTLGTITLGPDGKGTFSTTTLAAGTYTVTATYSGDSNYEPSRSPAQTLSVKQPTAAISLTATPRVTTPGSTVTLSATVKASSGSSVPTGTVRFLRGTTLIGTAPLKNGIAILSTSTLPEGVNSITASYGGDATFKPVTSSPVTVTVRRPAATTTRLTSSSPTVSRGKPVTFTAFVTSATRDASPSGTVTFLDGRTILGTGAVSNGVARFTISTLSVGTHQITAAYGGDSLFKPSTSAVLTETVTR